MTHQVPASPVRSPSPTLSERSRTSRALFLFCLLKPMQSNSHVWAAAIASVVAPFIQENANGWHTKSVLPNLSFKGEAQRHGTLAIKRRACGPFCACCPARHAVGLPLNSNVRPHSPPPVACHAFNTSAHATKALVASPFRVTASW
jgi:hypothetical protein